MLSVIAKLTLDVTLIYFVGRVQVPSGTLRRQQPELPPLGDPLALRCSTFCPKAAPSSAAPFLALTMTP